MDLESIGCTIKRASSYSAGCNKAMTIQEWKPSIDKLNELENVKADAETGLVCMFKNGKWNLLDVSLYFRHSETGYFVNYEKMSIGIKEADGVQYLVHGFMYDDCNYYTLVQQNVIVINTQACLSVFDNDTSKFIALGQAAYSVKDVYFDADFNRVAKGIITQRAPNIQAFQHIYIINATAILITHETVEARNNKVIIGGHTEYIFCFHDHRGFETSLNCGDKTIILKDFAAYIVKPDANKAFNGFIIPNYEKYYGRIFEIEGVWIGILPFNTFERLSPYKPGSGKQTKAAAALECN